MGAPRGVSEVTKAKIREAARRLFAERGINGVTVREIAAAAGVTHALVHRYFGTKEEMAKEILLAELERTNTLIGAADDPEDVGAIVRRILSHELIEDPTTLRLILRAELDGIKLEDIVGATAPRPFALLATWLQEHPSGPAGLDPGIATMIIGSSMFGLASVTPWLAAAVGVEGKDEATIRRECIEVLVGMVEMAGGRRPYAVPTTS